MTEASPTKSVMDGWYAVDDQGVSYRLALGAIKSASSLKNVFSVDARTKLTAEGGQSICLNSGGEYEMKRAKTIIFVIPQLFGIPNMAWQIAVPVSIPPA
ncbi:MAG: hypothetical protein EPO26_11550 [Chloroflexota bacterium]|nr:MAG: hypothetical protein EPO26_11550 [Chloroflexota bacterium]